MGRGLRGVECPGMWPGSHFILRYPSRPSGISQRVRGIKTQHNPPPSQDNPEIFEKNLITELPGPILAQNIKFIRILAPEMGP